MACYQKVILTFMPSNFTCAAKSRVLMTHI